MSDGCHPLVTILGVLCPQLQGFLVLVAEVDREIMLHREEDISDYQVSTEAATSAAISLFRKVPAATSAGPRLMMLTDPMLWIL